MSIFFDLPLMIEPSDLAPRLGVFELVLVDLTSAARYAKGHTLGARFVDSKRAQWGQSPAPGLLPTKADLEALFGELGHCLEATYMVYDNEGGSWAGRFIWLLDVIGHHCYHYLNGGLPAWIADAQVLDREVPAPVGGLLPPTPHDEPSATREYLRGRLGAADLAAWDARNPNEYVDTKAFVVKAGHVPGVINFEWAAGMDPARALRIRTDIAEVLEDPGITPGKEVIIHCQTHHRFGFTYLVAKALGYSRVKGCVSSWSEWGNHPDTLVEV